MGSLVFLFPTLPSVRAYSVFCGLQCIISPFQRYFWHLQKKERHSEIIKCEGKRELYYHYYVSAEVIQGIIVKETR